MLTYSELESAWRDVVLPTDSGTIRGLVVRPVVGSRVCPDTMTLTIDEGVVGDWWSSDPKREVDCQVTVIMSAVTELLARAADPALAGDNLIVDLDLGEANLPTGSRLEIGDVVLEVTPEIHAGGKKFAQRFGQEAVRWVNARETRERRLRGVNCRVIRGGIIAVGDAIAVRRP